MFEVFIIFCWFIGFNKNLFPSGVFFPQFCDMEKIAEFPKE
jgi:hypothetical protein